MIESSCFNLDLLSLPDPFTEAIGRITGSTEICVGLGQHFREFEAIQRCACVDCIDYHPACKEKKALDEYAKRESDG